jgi:hypothetical protein
MFSTSRTRDYWSLASHGPDIAKRSFKPRWDARIAECLGRGKAGILQRAKQLKERNI